VGDEIIKLTAATIKGLLRTSDIFARMSGEEFAAVLPGTSKRGAMQAAKNIRNAIRNLIYETKTKRKNIFYNKYKCSVTKINRCRY
jgi:diguanylate cyclase (GGDEF)-like protein